ncbi:UNVERIFIED_CONTAM: hypothetical protein GTU68_031836 [Idotea baltica]|nr:hypothetical protein [Idotea baltica]
MGRGGLIIGQKGRQNDSHQYRLCSLPLVSCDGARVFRRFYGRCRNERQLYLH